MCSQFFPAVVRMWVLPQLQPLFHPLYGAPRYRQKGHLGLEGTTGQPDKARKARKIRARDYEGKAQTDTPKLLAFLEGHAKN